jgi:hypothetical protein
MVKKSIEAGSWQPVTDVVKHDHRACRGDRIVHYQQV